MKNLSKTGGRSIADPMQDLGEGLYLFSAADKMQFYVLTQDPPAQATPLSFETFWQKGHGWCLFTPADLSKIDISGWADAARHTLPPISSAHNYANAFVWMEAADDFQSPLVLWWQSSRSTLGQGGGNIALSCDRISLSLDAQIGALAYELRDASDGAPAVIVLASETANVLISVDGEAQAVGFPNNPIYPSGAAWVAQIAFDGPQAGSFAMPLGLDLGTLADQFGLETTYQYDPAQMADDAPRSNELKTVRMPLFAPQAAAPTDQSGLVAFNVLLNPYFPYLPEAAGLRIDRAGRMLGGAAMPDTSYQSQQVANARALVSPYGAASDGAVVTLTPADPLEENLPFDAYIGGGFAYSPQDPKSTDTAPATPLTPAGVFVPNSVSPDHTARAAAPTDGGVDLMPGLFALDFLRLAKGDRINFEPRHPAYIAPADSAQTRSGMTTSYISVRKGNESAGRGYFGQSSTANLYLPDDAAASGVLSAALARLSPLAATPAFPMLFLGGVFLDHPVKGPINPGLTADMVGRLDQKALGPKRHAKLLDAPDGPLVQLPPSATARLRSAAADTHPVITPQGYIVDVDVNGVFTDITLGVGTGDAITPNALRFEGTGTPKKVSPVVSTLLTRENLFLVASKVGADWNFQNRIEVAGFEFAVALEGVTGGIEPGSKPSILIIKLDARRSLKEMALDRTSWTNGARYVDDVDDIIARLQVLFADAKPPKTSTDEDPFAAFRALLDNKAWTGVIAFDTPIDGNGMPPDLQMLLGGIPGQLRAHHVGVQTSKVTADKVAQSSVFGVINYHRDDSLDLAETPTPDPDYQVAELVAQIGNSAIVQLHVTVELIVEQLLGRHMELSDPKEGAKANILSINGKYQKHGDVGRVTFVTSKPFEFKPVIPGEATVRVIEAVNITHASLVPVTAAAPKGSSRASNDLTHVGAHFVLDGDIVFNADPFAGSEGLDLFSYGQPLTQDGTKKQGLDFTGLTVSIDFDLDAQGAMVPSSKEVVMLTHSLTPAPSPSAVRPQSLLGSLPMQLSSFVVAAPDTKVGNGAKTVNVLELMAPIDSTDAPRVPTKDGDTLTQAPTPVSPFTTSAPAFGLTYDISLGSLGALSSAHAGLSAALTIGWGPSPTVPDSDAACVMIALPSLSAGYQGFDLQGFISTKFNSANLLKVQKKDHSNVYAMSFDNVQLAVFGFGLPPGVMIDFVLFSGNAASATKKVTDSSSIGWLLSATTDKPKGTST